eukprot:14373279-Ditylum_brightwellii.AAC.1
MIIAIFVRKDNRTLGNIDVGVRVGGIDGKKNLGIIVGASVGLLVGNLLDGLTKQNQRAHQNLSQLSDYWEGDNDIVGMD